MDPGLKCRVCIDSDDGQCKNADDLGESKECPSGQVCVFEIIEYNGVTTYSRGCAPDSGKPCIEDNQEGVSALKKKSGFNANFFHVFRSTLLCAFVIQKIAIQ